MKRINLLRTTAILNSKSLITAVLLVAASTSWSQNSGGNSVSNKEKAMAILNSLESRDQVGPGYISDERYIQHNLVIADNKPGFLALQKWLPEGNKVNIVRAFEDGDYVFLNVGYNLGGPMVGMDIFRFKNGKAVEHWDNLQLVPKLAATGTHTMIDGPTTPKDLDRTAENKKLIRKYVQEVFVNGHPDKRDKYIDGDNFVEHHPGFADGLSGLKYTAIHLVLGQGNFCLVAGEAFVGGKHCALYDLYRIESGKLAEHWGTIEEIPAKETWKNPNGKF